MEYPDLGKHCSEETCKRLGKFLRFIPTKFFRRELITFNYTISHQFDPFCEYILHFSPNKYIYALLWIYVADFLPVKCDACAKIFW